jgi:predicted nuclease of predicted toxin-antitoxin system
VKFLIDECLHTSLVTLAKGDGHEATHVNFRGLKGAKDRFLMTLVRDEGFTFVTNNARDFRRLFGREAIHRGLIILIPNVPPDVQRVLFGAILDELSGDEGLTNQALEATFVDGDIQIDRYQLPKGA